MTSFLLMAALAQAADDPTGGPPSNPNSPDKTTADYLLDLDSDDASDRLLAARVLEGLLKRSLRTVEHARPGSLASDDAKAALVELEERLPSTCSDALSYDNVVAPCAEMLAILAYKPALPLIQAAAEKETRKGVKKRLDAAIELLNSQPDAAP